MRTNVEKVEEELRSQIYTALVQLVHVGEDDKPGIAKRLLAASRKLHDLIVHDRIPKKGG